MDQKWALEAHQILLAQGPQTQQSHLVQQDQLGVVCFFGMSKCYGQPPLPVQLPPLLPNRFEDYSWPQCDQAVSTIEMADSMSTATIRDTPCSCMVTPISCSAICIVILLCEINKNCVPFDIVVTSLAKRSVLVSSNGASTSSSKQNGEIGRAHV